MKTSLKLSAYGAALAVLVAGTYTIGSLVGDPAGPAAETSHGDVGHAAEPDGLASSRNGYTLVPDDPMLGSGTFAFRITGPDGTPVTAFDESHDKRLHLIVVRRDTTGFRHLHPEMDAAGTWRVPLTVDAGGAYRAFADFVPTGGPPTTLGTDLFAAGDFRPFAHPQSRTATVDGFTVALAGDLVPGTASPLTLTVSRGGAPVVRQPYLGADGHLVALREGDLAYLHVHPAADAPGGSAVAFAAEVPTAGRYRLFLDFQVDGVVRTAEFTLAAGSTT
jgi:hypothetical protein